VVADDDVDQARVDGVREVDQLAVRLPAGEAADALVRDHDHRVSLGLPRDTRELVRGCDAVGHLDRAEAPRQHDGRGLLVRDADDGDLCATHVEVGDRIDAAQVVLEVLQVRRDVPVRLAGRARARRRSCQVDHLLEMSDAAVEVVVPERVHLHPHHALGLHRRLLVEEARDGR
jgi:hypothetical protein